jgi:hypothetical protein
MSLFGSLLATLAFASSLHPCAQYASTVYFFTSKIGLAGLRKSYAANDAEYFRASSSTRLLALCKLYAFSTHTDRPSAKTL